MPFAPCELETFHLMSFRARDTSFGPTILVRSPSSSPGFSRERRDFITWTKIDTRQRRGKSPQMVTLGDEDDITSALETTGAVTCLHPPTPAVYLALTPACRSRFTTS